MDGEEGAGGCDEEGDLVSLFVFAAGLVVGSFLNVLIQRWPRNESVIRPGSHCPACGRAIAWFDNIPVLSFVILRGRCRNCKRAISFRYPFVEIASGVLWLWSWRTHGMSPTFWTGAIFVSLLLVVSMTDLETGLIPDQVSLGGIAVGLMMSLAWPELQGSSVRFNSFVRSALGMVAGGGLIYLTGVVGNVVFRRQLVRLGMDQSMGGGDVKLLAMAGSFLGWEKVLLAFFTAPLLGLPFALYERFAKKEATIPYGPFLSLACLVQFYFGGFIRSYFLGV